MYVHKADGQACRQSTGGEKSLTVVDVVVVEVVFVEVVLVEVVFVEVVVVEVVFVEVVLVEVRTRARMRWQRKPCRSESKPKRCTWHNVT